MGVTGEGRERECKVHLSNALLNKVRELYYSVKFNPIMHLGFLSPLSAINTSSTYMCLVHFIWGQYFTLLHLFNTG
mgnify:CR=1 FL=1